MTDDISPIDADLTRLADGTLDAREAAALRDRISRSPELAARLREQERAVTLTRATADQIGAPASLRASVDRLVTPAARPSRSRPRLGALAGIAATAAAIAVVVVLLTGGGSGDTPSVAAAARLALRAPTVTSAPARAAGDPARLAIHVGTVPFPTALAPHGGTPAVATRRDRLGGRAVTTVYYRGAGTERIGYAIVAGRPLALPTGPGFTIGGVRYAYAREGSAKLIAWHEGGFTCVIVGRGVSDAELSQYADGARAVA